MRLLTTLFLFPALLFLCSPSRAGHGVGAQVWLEPGMSRAEVEGYFKTLHQHHLHSARLFMMWNFMEPRAATWDFSVFDYAFDAAATYKVRIVATLMPNFGPPHRGFYYKTQDGAIAKSARQLEESRLYIRKVVERYRKHPALDTWMLMNEPGQMPAPDSLALDRFRVFLENKYKTVAALNQAWLTGFGEFAQVSYSANWAGGGFTWPVSYLDWQQFWNGHLTWYLREVASEIRKWDNQTPLHVNPHALLDIPHRYELGQWKSFLNSLGASIHPVWHLGDFKREEYPLGISMVAELVRSAAGEKPFWVTELQGGHNMYTGSQPVNPTREELKTWLWTSILSGADRTIFWCLNPRPKGGESGEWAMLNFRGEPSPRLAEAGKIAGLCDSLGLFSEKRQAITDRICLVFSRETAFLQERNGKAQAQTARQAKAHFQSAIGCYQALRMQGFHPEIRFADELPAGSAGDPMLWILPHATALSDETIRNLHQRCQAGDQVLLTGLTGLFDPEERTRFLKPNSLDSLTGIVVEEVVTPENDGRFLLPYEQFRWKASTRNATETDPGLYQNRIGKGICFTLGGMADLAFYLQKEEMGYPGFLAEIAKSFRNPMLPGFHGPAGSYTQVLSLKNGQIGLVHVPKGKVEKAAELHIPGGSSIRWIGGQTPVKNEGSGLYRVEAGQTLVWLSEKPILPAEPKKKPKTTQK